MFTEGWFVYWNKTISTKTDLLSDLWKEYALADSRYMYSEPSVLYIEGFTAVVWGPLCILIAVLYLRRNVVYKDVLSLIVSTGQSYGFLGLIQAASCTLQQASMEVTVSIGIRCSIFGFTLWHVSPNSVLERSMDRYSLVCHL